MEEGHKRGKREESQTVISLRQGKLKDREILRGEGERASSPDLGDGKEGHERTIFRGILQGGKKKGEEITRRFYSPNNQAGRL